MGSWPSCSSPPRPWSTEVVDGSPDAGAHASLALTVEDRPVISYFDDTNNALKVARYDGAGWQIASLDGTYVSGCQTSPALDGAGRTYISYCGLNFAGAPELKYAFFDSDGWSVAPVSNEAVPHTSLPLDSAGRPHIAYLASGAVRYAVYTGSDWVFETAAAPAAGWVSLGLEWDADEAARAAAEVGAGWWPGEAQDVLVGMVICFGSSEQVVGGLPLGALQDLVGLAMYAAVWDSAGVEAGDYRLEAIVRDAGGAVLDRAWTEFTLGDWSRVCLPCVLRRRQW